MPVPLPSILKKGLQKLFGQIREQVQHVVEPMSEHERLAEQLAQQVTQVTVSRTSQPMPPHASEHMRSCEQQSVFICYAHPDEDAVDPKKRWFSRLLEFLRPLQRQGTILTWSDRTIRAGDKWQERIAVQLNACKAALLLISPAFLASDYVANSELPVLLYRVAESGLRIFPIIIAPCLYEEALFRYPSPMTGPHEIKLSSFQAVNPPSRTLVEMSEGEQNRVLLEAALQLSESLRKLQMVAGRRVLNAGETG